MSQQKHRTAAEAASERYLATLDPETAVRALNAYGDDAFHEIRHQWDGRLLRDKETRTHGSPELAALTLATYLREWHGVQSSGLVTTLREMADGLQDSQPELAEAYRGFAEEMAGHALYLADDSDSDEESAS